MARRHRKKPIDLSSSATSAPHALLRIAMQAAVPLWINALQAAGGPAGCAGRLCLEVAPRDCRQALA
jgi:hypothetical protein